MNREWKPGDVAMRTLRTFDGKKSISMVAECGQHMSNGVHWHHSDGGWDLLTYVSAPVESMATYRPLVVIDPEDREQVERLLSCMRGASRVQDDEDNLAAALREFADPTPPKPDEPTGLGAVVEDADGVLWVRAGKELQTPDHWRATSGENLVGWWATWDRIAVARVLSEGVRDD